MSSGKSGLTIEKARKIPTVYQQLVARRDEPARLEAEAKAKAIAEQEALERMAAEQRAMLMALQNNNATDLKDGSNGPLVVAGGSASEASAAEVAGDLKKKKGGGVASSLGINV